MFSQFNAPFYKYKKKKIKFSESFFFPPLRSLTQSLFEMRPRSSLVSLLSLNPPHPRRCPMGDHQRDRGRRFLAPGWPARPEYATLGYTSWLCSTIQPLPVHVLCAFKYWGRGRHVLVVVAWCFPSVYQWRRTHVSTWNFSNANIGTKLVIFYNSLIEVTSYILTSYMFFFVFYK